MRNQITTAALLTLFFVGAAGAQQYAMAGGAATGRITVSGGSTVRSWSCDVTDFHAAVRTPTAEAMPNQHESALFTIPVRAIDCRNGTMNNHLRDALHGDHYPDIRFELTGYTLVDATTMRAQGTLTIGERATPVEVTATYSAAAGTLRVQGQKELRMTELGVRPPRLMLGTLRVHDPVTIAFDLVIQQSAVTIAALDAANGR